MTNDELGELFKIVELNKPYAYKYASICNNGITPKLQNFLLPAVSPRDQLLGWVNLAPAEVGNSKVCIEGSFCQQLQLP